MSDTAARRNGGYESGDGPLPDPELLPTGPAPGAQKATATAATDRYLHGAYHPNGECPNGMCAQPSRRAHPDAELVPWGGKTLCKCPHCGGLDVSYLGRDGLDICGSCHGLFVCRQEALDGT